MRTFGLILAGGQARRMGGVDKALIELAGETLLARCIARLAPQCGSLLLSANSEPEDYASFGITVLADVSATQEGPLAGLLAALDQIARNKSADFIVSVPVDTPFVSHDLVSRLRDAYKKDDAAIAVATSGARSHHAVALWPVAIFDSMRAAFAAGERSVGRFAAQHRIVQVEWPVAPIDPFFNINTPNDLATAEDFIARRSISGI